MGHRVGLTVNRVNNMNVNTVALAFMGMWLIISSGILYNECHLACVYTAQWGSCESFMQSLYNDDLNVCYNMIMNNWCNSTIGDLRSNVSVLRDMIDIRDGVKECDSLCIDDVLFIIDDICIN